MVYMPASAKPLHRVTPYLRHKLFFTDKDNGQIRVVLTSNSLAPCLCLWNMKRAIKRKVAEMKTKTIREWGSSLRQFWILFSNWNTSVPRFYNQIARKSSEERLQVCHIQTELFSYFSRREASAQIFYGTLVLFSELRVMGSTRPSSSFAIPNYNKTWTTLRSMEILVSSARQTSMLHLLRHVLLDKLFTKFHHG